MEVKNSFGKITKSPHGGDVIMLMFFVGIATCVWIEVSLWIDASNDEDDDEEEEMTPC